MVCQRVLRGPPNGDSVRGVLRAKGQLLFAPGERWTFHVEAEGLTLKNEGGTTVHRRHRRVPIRERHRADPAAVQVHGAEMEAHRREVFGRIDEHDFFQAEAGGFDIPLAACRT
jgi:hypothetical protein